MRKFNVEWAAVSVWLAIDATARTLAAAGNRNIVNGDVLAPFSLVDKIIHGEPIDLSRQLPLLPWTIATFARVMPDTERFWTIFAFSNAAGAVAVTATLLFLYLATRLLLPFRQAIVVLVLASLNASLFLSSTHLNPTLVYGTAFSATLYFLLIFESGRRYALPLVVSTALLGMLIRWEGALLLVVVIGWIWFGFGTDRISKWERLGATAVAGIGMLALILFHAAHSSVPFGFLINTGARDQAGAALGYSLSELGELVVRSLSWKFEKLHAFAHNLTLLGIGFAILGMVASLRSSPALAMPLVYWIAYEAVMLIYTLVLPVGSNKYLMLRTQVEVEPVQRYYHVLTPWLTLMMYLGVKQLVMNAGGYRRLAAACGGIMVVCYVFWNVSVASVTYEKNVRRASLEVEKAVRLADFFRANDIRGREIIVLRQEGTAWRYDDKFANHAFLFAILSGGNLVNCVGKDLSNPNKFCSKRYGEFSEGKPNPAIINADFTILLNARGVAPSELRNRQRVAEIDGILVLGR